MPISSRVYGVKPDELGHFLLELGRKLGTRSDRDKPPASFERQVHELFLASTSPTANEFNR